MNRSSEARASARSRYSCRIHLFVFQGLHPRFTPAIFPGARLVAHADLAALRLQQIRVIVRKHTGCRDRNDAPARAAGCRSSNAIRSACQGRSSSTVRSSAQPITRREKASMTTARYTNSALQTDVGDVGHPELVDAAQLHLALPDSDTPSGRDWNRWSPRTSASARTAGYPRA